MFDLLHCLLLCIPGERLRYGDDATELDRLLDEILSLGGMVIGAATAENEGMELGFAYLAFMFLVSVAFRLAIWLVSYLWWRIQQ